jgi:hypothetical protein
MNTMNILRVAALFLSILIVPIDGAAQQPLELLRWRWTPPAELTSLLLRRPRARRTSRRRPRRRRRSRVGVGTDRAGARYAPAGAPRRDASSRRDYQATRPGIVPTDAPRRDERRSVSGGLLRCQIEGYVTRRIADGRHDPCLASGAPISSRRTAMPCRPGRSSRSSRRTARAAAVAVDRGDTGDRLGRRGLSRRDAGRICRSSYTTAS